MVKHCYRNHIIFNIFQDYEIDYPKLKDYLGRIQPLSVLDLGCGVPINLFILYHVYECEVLQSVDKNNEYSCVVEYLQKNLKHLPEEVQAKIGNANSFYDLYKNSMNPEKGEKVKISQIATFEKVFTKNFYKGDAIDFIVDSKTNYDLVIISNLLHFFSDKQIDIVLHNVKRSLNEKGVLLIRVQHKDNFDYLEFQEILLSYFPNSEIFEYHNGRTWHNSIIINRPDLLE